MKLESTDESADNIRYEGLRESGNRLTAIRHQRSAGEFARFDYTLNKVGNRTSKTETWAGPSGPLVRTESYSYDAVDQVMGVGYRRNHIVQRTVNYQYDAVGNRTQVQEKVGASSMTTTYLANWLNQYTVVGNDTPTYDANGNLSAVAAALPGDCRWTYRYDAQNRLISAQSAQSAVSLAYDARNRCVARTVNGVTTYLIYDGWLLLEERDELGTVLARYYHGANVDEWLARTTPTGTVYYHHDGLGSTVALTDGTGNVVESYTYDVYGQPSILSATYYLPPPLPTVSSSPAASTSPSSPSTTTATASTHRRWAASCKRIPSASTPKM